MESKAYRPELTDVLEYCRSRTSPSFLQELDPTARKKCLNTFRKYARKFTFDSTDGNLYYLRGQDDNSGRAKVLFTKQEVDTVLRDIHGNDRPGPHFGVKQTQANITERFYWRSITEDVKTWVAGCEKCQNNPKVRRVICRRRPIHASAPWWTISIDLFGTLPESKPQGYKYILTATCLFSKWVEAEPLMDSSTESVFKVFNKWFCRWGLPKRIITDEIELDNTMLRALLVEKYGDKHCVLASFPPQLNDEDGRSRAPIETHLSQMVNDFQDDWHNHLEEVCWSVRSSVNESTKLTPYEIMTLQKPRFPSEISSADDNVAVQTTPIQAVMLYVRNKQYDGDHLHAMVNRNITEDKEKCRRLSRQRRRQRLSLENSAIGMEEEVIEMG